jgi:hypothetical protein
MYVNRIREYLPPEPEPPRQTTADRLLAKAYALKIEALRFEDNDGESETSINVEVRSTLDDVADLQELLSRFRGGEGTVAQ